MPLGMRRNPLTSMLNFAADRDREAASLGSVITQLASPMLGQMGVQTEDTPQAAVLRGPAPQAQPLGAFTGPAMQPTLVDQPASDDFMRRLVKQESGGNPNAVSPAGAIGLTQVIPSTAMDPGYGVPTIFDLADEQGVDYSSRTKDEAKRLLFNPDLNYQFGELYKNAMAERFGGDPALTAAAYNAGPGAVEQYGGVPPFAETQNYVRALTGGAPRTAAGGSGSMSGGSDSGMMGGNVEDILAQLYPQMSPEDQRKERRKDFFSAASQGLSALSRGAPIDFSNIKQAQEARKRQAVIDMRERERARAAASLVYSQTGDADLATGIATGAISYGDVLSERQLARAEKEADRLKLLSAHQAEILAPTLLDLGLPQDRVDEIVAYGKEGGDINDLLTPMQSAEAAKKVRESEAAQDELVTSYLGSNDPSQVMIGQLVRGGMPLKDAVDAAAKLMPDTTGKEFANIAEAKALFEGGATNPATGQPFASAAEALAALNFYKAPSQNQGVSLTMGPGGVVTGLTVGGTAPAAAPGAVIDVAKPATGTATTIGPDGKLTETPLEGAVAPQIATVDLAAKKQDLAAKIESAPDLAAKTAAEAELAQVELEEAKSVQGLDAKEREARIAAAEATAAKAQIDADTAAADKAKLGSSQYAQAADAFAKFDESAKEVLKVAESPWSTGVLGGVSTTVGELLGFPTQRTTMIAQAKRMGAQGMLESLIQAKAAGVTLTPVSNVDLEALGASKTLLSNPEALDGRALTNEVVFQHNFAKDALVGPKDLNRLDMFGQPYQVGENTLGVTEDTFARHWSSIPPEVADAWRNGDIAELPTADVPYGEASAVINKMAANWELYQGDLDRAKVGVAEAPEAADTEAAVNVPPAPAGFDGSADEWAATWSYMTEADRKQYLEEQKGKQ